MDAVLISTKGQIVLPVAVRKALGLKPGMRVNVSVDGKRAWITLAPAPRAASLKEIQALRAYDGKTLPVSAMRVTDYKAQALRPKPCAECGLRCLGHLRCRFGQACFTGVPIWTRRC
jgi:AbrB family looped-hinge helix DNA binding protein